jgi:PAS domain S-box-containing protein
LTINDDFPLVVATMPANARQRRIALGGFVIMAVAVAITLPFANLEQVRIDAFVPVIQTVMCGADLLTAVILFVQYAVQSQRALLALASGYVSSGLFALLQTFTIPGAYVPGVLIGDDLYSAGWLFVFWHTVFPLAVIAYAFFKNSKTAEQSSRPTGVAVGITIACVVTATAGLTWVATGGRYLPNLYAGLLRQSPFAQDMSVFLALLTGAAVVFLLFVRKQTILDQWLIVALLAWMPNLVAVILFPVVRYTLGWYLSRVYALVAGSAVLFALLTETLFLYARVANAFVLLRRERAERRAIFNTVVDGIITIDHNGSMQTLNPAAARLFGYSLEEVVGRNVKMLMPERYRREHDGYLNNYLTTGQARIIGSGRVVEGQRKDGSIFPLELAVSETDVGGRRMFTGVLRDITERKRVEEHQRLLLSELDHRVKNVLAEVAVVAASTRQGSPSIDEFVRSLDGRIQSMAAAHDLLSQSGWQSVGLDALVRNQLTPYATETNLAIRGPTVVLTTAEIQAVARVLHELATNAAKYGALSRFGGQISVSWKRKPNGHTTNLVLVWRELGGPPVVSEVRSSYGTNLIRNLIPHELGGTVDLVLAAEGVNCTIEFPLHQA